MFIKTVPDALARNLESLGKEKAIAEFYLAGGTALALQLGHRLSYDLDFFTEKNFSEKKLIEMLGLKSLVYFTDAEEDEMPRMFLDISWKEVKRQVEEEVKRFMGKENMHL